MTDNIYMPYLMRIERITYEAPDVRTFMLKFINEEDEKGFSFKAGQFGEYSVYGVGESTFCIASSPTRKGYIECTFRQTGKVTMHWPDVRRAALSDSGVPMAILFLSMNGKGKICCLLQGE